MQFMPKLELYGEGDSIMTAYKPSAKVLSLYVLEFTLPGFVVGESELYLRVESRQYTGSFVLDLGVPAAHKALNDVIDKIHATTPVVMTKKGATTLSYFLYITEEDKATLKKVNIEEDYKFYWVYQPLYGTIVPRRYRVVDGMYTAQYMVGMINSKTNDRYQAEETTRYNDKYTWQGMPTLTMNDKPLQAMGLPTKLKQQQLGA